MSSDAQIGNIQLTEGMRIREKRSAKPGQKSEPYRTIFAIDPGSIQLQNTETNRITKASTSRLSRYEIHPGDVPIVAEPSAAGNVSPPKFPAGTFVRKVDTVLWEEIERFDESSDSYMMTDSVVRIGGYGVPVAEVESEGWEIWGPTTPPENVVGLKIATGDADFEKVRRLHTFNANKTGAVRPTKENNPVTTDNPPAGESPSGLFSSTDNNDFLETKKNEIRERITELQPKVNEYSQLAAALNALEGKPAVTSGAKRGRPRGTGTRAAEALAIIEKEPGLNANEIAERMGINQNYLYRVLPGLEQDGKLEKRGRGWYLVGA